MAELIPFLNWSSWPRTRETTQIQETTGQTNKAERARLAAIAWPRGDAQGRAQQVLLKRLGITQEAGGQNSVLLQRFINLFKGPLSSMVIKALEAVSGLDGPALLRQIKA